MKTIKELEAIVEEIKENAKRTDYSIKNRRFQEALEMLDWVKDNPEDEEVRQQLEGSLRSCRFWSAVNSDEAKQFTVGSMIDFLKQYPADMTISITASADCGYILAGGNRLQPMITGNNIDFFCDEYCDY